MHASMQTTNDNMTTTLCEKFASRSATVPAAAAKTNKLPLWLKLAFTGFMAVLVPIYWHHYGPTNFLYFCDVALFLTLAAVWTEIVFSPAWPPLAFLFHKSLVR